MAHIENASDGKYYPLAQLAQVQDASLPLIHVPLAYIPEDAISDAGGFIEIKANVPHRHPEIHMEITEDRNTSSVGLSYANIFPPFSGWRVQSWRNKEGGVPFYSAQLHPRIDRETHNILSAATANISTRDRLHFSLQLINQLPICMIAPRGLEVVRQDGTAIFSFNDEGIMQCESEEFRVQTGDELPLVYEFDAMAIGQEDEGGSIEDTKKTVVYGIEVRTKNFTDIERVLSPLIALRQDVNAIRELFTPYIRIVPFEGKDEDYIDETHGEVG